MTEIELWNCPGLRARITEGQCQRNSRKASKASPFLGLEREGGGLKKLTPRAAAEVIGLGCCVDCKGVRAIAEGKRPNVVDADALLARALLARPIKAVVAGSPAGSPLSIQRRHRPQRPWGQRF